MKSAPNLKQVAMAEEVGRNGSYEQQCEARESTNACEVGDNVKDDKDEFIGEDDIKDAMSDS